MKGFFTAKETESKSRPGGKILSCASCGLYKHAESPKMKPYGNFAKEILNIGEAPGAVEDERGKPWQGKAGRLLQKTYRRLGIDLFEDCLNINAVNCRPMNDEGENRAPTNYEMDCCRGMILQTIYDRQPKVVVLFGGSALYCLLGHRWKKDLGGITKWRGWTIPDRDFKTWVCPTFHSSYVSRSEKEVETVWIQDLECVVEKINEPLPRYRKPRINVIEDLSPLNDIKSDQVSFDYETTGLKPHAKGHKIVCASIATDENSCYAFMMPSSRKACQPFTNLLANPHIGKMAHNIKFEETWSVVRLRQSVVNWEWDSMLAAHVLDNRPGITGLKFQTYVNFGVVDYASEVTPYLLGVEGKNGNSLNRIHELTETESGRKRLLEYCALDSVYEYRLATLQQKIMNYSFLPF